MPVLMPPAVNELCYLCGRFVSDEDAVAAFSSGFFLGYAHAACQADEDAIE